MNDEQLLRYSRHILLPEIDIAGQQALLDARRQLAAPDAERGGLVTIVVRFAATPKVLADAAFLLAQEKGKHGL